MTSKVILELCARIRQPVLEYLVGIVNCNRVTSIGVLLYCQNCVLGLSDQYWSIGFIFGIVN